MNAHVRCGTATCTVGATRWAGTKEGTGVLTAVNQLRLTQDTLLETIPRAASSRTGIQYKAFRCKSKYMLTAYVSCMMHAYFIMRVCVQYAHLLVA